MGSIVRLTNGEKAQVIGQTKLPLRPVIKLLNSSTNKTNKLDMSKTWTFRSGGHNR